MLTYKKAVDYMFFMYLNKLLHAFIRPNRFLVDSLGDSIVDSPISCNNDNALFLSQSKSYILVGERNRHIAKQTSSRKNNVKKYKFFPNS